MIAQIDKRYTKSSWSRVYTRFLSYFLFEGRPLTTRGRWINGIVFLLFKVWMFLPRLKKVKQPVFIIGTGRSGTTVLGIILSMHKDVGFLNEPKAIWHAAYGKEDIIGSYSTSDASYQLTAENATKPEVATKLHKIFGAYLFFGGNKQLVDKYPELIFRIPFVLKLFPDAKFLFLVRNGWDTIQSIKHWSERLGSGLEHEVHDWWGRNDRKWDLLVEQVLKTDPDLGYLYDLIQKEQDHINRAALEWLLTMKKGLEVQNKYPAQVYTINYETLTENPDQVLKRLLKILNLQSDSRFMAYSKWKLQEREPKGEVSLNPELEKPFAEMMKRLGY